jgi:hypothetical protein
MEVWYRYELFIARGYDKIIRDNQRQAPSGCIEWTGRRISSTKYGVFSAGRHDGAGRNQYYAHRASWCLHNKADIPNGAYICHHCDNPICINPEHLYLGDGQTNAQDKIDRGRTLRGQKNPGSKLNDKLVKKLRQMYSDGWSSNQLAEKFGIRQPTVSRAIRGESWSHVPGVCKPRSMRKMTVDQVLQIRNSSRLLREDAEDFGTTTSTISKIRKRQTWAHV